MLIAVAHNLASLHNVGSIFRTADGAGFDHVILSGYTGTPPDPRIAKVALGAEEILSWEHIAKFDALMRRLEGVHVVVLEQAADSVTPSELPALLSAMHGDIALVACDELYGAPRELLERADTIVELPMRGQKHSLNVSVAFGVASYALAHAYQPMHRSELRSGKPRIPVREGVLTRGRTNGETPTP